MPPHCMIWALIWVDTASAPAQSKPDSPTYLAIIQAEAHAFAQLQKGQGLAKPYSSWEVGVV